MFSCVFNNRGPPLRRVTLSVALRRPHPLCANSLARAAAPASEATHPAAAPDTLPVTTQRLEECSLCAHKVLGLLRVTRIYFNCCLTCISLVPILSHQQGFSVGGGGAEGENWTGAVTPPSTPQRRDTTPINRTPTKQVSNYFL